MQNDACNAQNGHRSAQNGDCSTQNGQHSAQTEIVLCKTISVLRRTVTKTCARKIDSIYIYSRIPFSGTSFFYAERYLHKMIPVLHRTVNILGRTIFVLCRMILFQRKIAEQQISRIAECQNNRICTLLVPKILIFMLIN